MEEWTQGDAPSLRPRGVESMVLLILGAVASVLLRVGFTPFFSLVWRGG